MKDNESIKEYSNKVMKTVNQLRLLGKGLPKRIIINEVLVSLLKKFQAKISSLEDLKDISQLTLKELVNAR